MNELDEACGQLLTWSSTLHNTITSLLPEVRATLASDDPLPPGCPSRAALAELVFRKVKDRLQEVEGCVKEVEQAIWKAGK